MDGVANDGRTSAGEADNVVNVEKITSSISGTLSGSAGDDWRFNFFSHGPQGCPGAGLSIFLGQAFLGHLISFSRPKLDSGPRLKRERLPYGLDVYGLEVRL